MLLSIVIPTYNRSTSLKQNLHALKEHIVDLASVETCVVDDCSTVDQKEKNVLLCREYDVKYQFCSDHHGPSHARNTGLFATSGEWVAFLDDDVCVDKNWYTVLTESILHTHPGDAGIEGATRSRGNGVWDSEVENCSGGLYLTSNITYRREALMRCDGFDETFTWPFAEDQELALRIQKWGTVRFNEKCIVYHQPRNINLVSYCLHSFTRMHMLLDAEYHFYMKHRDRYHTFRNAGTFWGTLAAILFKHFITTCKRRTIPLLLHHPVQTGALLFATLMEQFAAWLYTPGYLIRAAFSNPSQQHAAVNWQKTARYWRIPTPVPYKHFFFRPRLLRSLLFHIHKKPVYNAITLLNKFSRLGITEFPRVFLRIDDMFLDNPECIEQFCDGISKTRAPFLAAVTGDDLGKKENAPLCDTIVKAGGSIGLHGFSHKGTFGPYTSEILQLSFPELDRLITSVTGSALSEEHTPIAFIPPFNAISWEQIVYLGNTFPIICGGPETMRFTGHCFGPVVLNSNAVYFPSCHPFYGHAATLVRSPIINQVKRMHYPICITLHLQAEAEDGFSSLLHCISLYRDFLTDWRTLYEPSVPDRNQRKEQCQ